MMASNHGNDTYNEVLELKYSSSTKNNYGRRQIQFVKWMKENYYDECFDSADELCFDKIDATMLNSFIGETSKWSTGKKVGQLKSHSNAEGNHAALLQLFEKNKVLIPSEFAKVHKIQNLVEK
jgi:hypothetical protein